MIFYKLKMTFCEINLLTTIIYNKAFFKQLDYGICSPIFETMESSAIAFLVFDLA